MSPSTPVPFPVSPVISSPDTYYTAADRVSTSSFPLISSSSSSADVPHTPSAAELIAGTRSFQCTFSRILESVRLMKAHLEAFDSSALLAKSYDFETDLLSLVSQVTEIADLCMDFDGGDYEISCSNLRFTLRTFLQMVESRRLNNASICLAFAVDAMYTFMEVSIQEVSGWKALQDQVILARPPSQDCTVQLEESRIMLPRPADDPPKPRQQKLSMLKRLRTVSSMTFRNSLPSPSDSTRRATLSPRVLRQMEQNLRLSTDQSPHPTAYHVASDDVNIAGAKRRPGVQRAKSVSLPARLQRALRRCKSLVKPEDWGTKDGAQRQRRDSLAFVRSRTRSFFGRKDAPPPVPPLPEI